MVGTGNDGVTMAGFHRHALRGQFALEYVGEFGRAVVMHRTDVPRCEPKQRNHLRIRAAHWLHFDAGPNRHPIGGSRVSKGPSVRCAGHLLSLTVHLHHSKRSRSSRRPPPKKQQLRVPGNVPLMATNPWRPIAGGHYLGTDPSKRFPVYTRGNAGEVFPEVQYPLSFTQTSDIGRIAFENSAFATGIVRPQEVAGDDTAMLATFGGYTYLNLSMIRLMTLRSPGANLAELDRALVGSSTAPPYVATKGDRSVRGSFRAVRFGLQTLQQKSVPELLADKARADEWLQNLPNVTTASDFELLETSRASLPMSIQLFENHLVVSTKCQVPTSLLAKFCETKIGDPTILGRLIAGAGAVVSAAPSQALWDLGRLVRASPELTMHFDNGVTGLGDRLAVDPLADPFCEQFRLFLAEFGARGPNEWESACPTWETNPELALVLVDRMRHTSPDHDPRLRHELLAVDSKTALAEADAKLNRAGKRKLRRLIASVLLFSQGRELAKTTVVRTIHGNRLMLRELGRRCAERSGGRPDDLWFVTGDEVDDYLLHPKTFDETIAERRKMRELMATREPPFIVNGVVPPFESWTVRGADRVEQVHAGQTLTGIPGCPGVARGRARVILDPADPRELAPGDVLIAPLTDPSWTPLFVPAEGVIVDVGASLSHAVIVSRELGIPCVVSVTNATRSIPDGALVEVDGTRGLVRILEMP